MRDVMTPAIRLDRRRFLLTSLGATAGAALTLGGVTTTVAAAAGTQWRGRTSANGWRVLDSAPAHRVEGTGGVHFDAADGDVATVLTHVVRRFHYEIATLAPGEVTGHTTSHTVAAPYESNYLSGTAIAIRPLLYPARAQGGFFPHELMVLRDTLADLEGVVKWGGDLRPAKESHFQIDVKPGDPALRRVAAKLRGWELKPDEGAGTIEATTPARLKAAKALAARQR
ncbi:hypothetical protein ACIBL5_32055 [Streptomyces sp. NPDC050516]|uniref:hypothetical protein n=1 Tax=Streptomyces sp. NPDC050516 TaxID=3365621 RepID=UPI0037A39443